MGAFDEVWQGRRYDIPTGWSREGDWCPVIGCEVTRGMQRACAARAACAVPHLVMTSLSRDTYIDLCIDVSRMTSLSRDTFIDLYINVSRMTSLSRGAHTSTCEDKLSGCRVHAHPKRLLTDCRGLCASDSYLYTPIQGTCERTARIHVHAHIHPFGVHANRLHNCGYPPSPHARIHVHAHMHRDCTKVTSSYPLTLSLIHI